MKQVTIYTDGACRGNPGPGGWGAIIIFGEHEKVFSGAECHTTNNRMELMAAIQALEALNTFCQIDFYTDSKYLQQGITEWLPGWKKKNWVKADKQPVKNVDLWQRLEKAVSSHQISWQWVKGHSGHPGNERADELANFAIDELLKRDT